MDSRRTAAAWRTSQELERPIRQRGSRPRQLQRHVMPNHRRRKTLRLQRLRIIFWIRLDSAPSAYCAPHRPSSASRLPAGGRFLRLPLGIPSLAGLLPAFLTGKDFACLAPSAFSWGWAGAASPSANLTPPDSVVVFGSLLGTAAACRPVELPFGKLSCPYFRSGSGSPTLFAWFPTARPALTCVYAARARFILSFFLRILRVWALSAHRGGRLPDPSGPLSLSGTFSVR